MNDKSLKNHFPMLKTRQEILAEIYQDFQLSKVFRSWEKRHQEEFLDFCSGQRGCKLIFDSFFKEILHPENHRERLEWLLSLFLKQPVKILRTLSNEHRISSGTSLLIMDIVVQLMNGSIANVEMQRIGYAFPGERTACYSADLLLRQYHRLKAEKGQEFSYRDIKKVYTIVLFEKSPEPFKKIRESCIHYGRVRFDSGLAVELPQEFIYVALDIFREILHNTGIRNELDAWLTFLCMDDTESIMKLIEQYPCFKPLYEEIYRHCLNLEDIMGFFSEELLEMDRNTVRYMVEEQQERLEKLNKEIFQKNEELSQRNVELGQMNAALSQKDEQLSQKDEQLSQKDEQLSQKEKKLEEQKRRIAELEALLKKMA